MAGRYVGVHPTVNHTTICRGRNLHHDERGALEEGIGEGKPQGSASTAHFLSSSTPAASSLVRVWSMDSESSKIASMSFATVYFVSPPKELAWYCPNRRRPSPSSSAPVHRRRGRSPAMVSPRPLRHLPRVPYCFLKLFTSFPWSRTTRVYPPASSEIHCPTALVAVPRAHCFPSSRPP